MILNGYGVLDAFLTLLRLGLALGVVALGFVAPGQWRRASANPELREHTENRTYLLFLLAFLLVALNVAAWPLLYLLLQSYVREWRDAGVMCIYGVTQIGAGSIGISRFLPGLLLALQCLKPILVFVSGLWFVLYLINRRTATAPLTQRTLLVLLLVGVLAAGDAAIELAYLVVPKKEIFLSGGCCSTAFDQEGARSLARGFFGDRAGSALTAIYYTVNVGMVLALTAYLRFGRPRVSAGWSLPLLVGTLASVVVNVLFLVEVAAPSLLHLPRHHCPYDLVQAAPRSLLAVGLFSAGSLFVGWGCWASWLGNCSEAMPGLSAMVTRLFGLGVIAYLTSVLTMSIELALA